MTPLEILPNDAAFQNFCMRRCYTAQWMLLTQCLHHTLSGSLWSFSSIGTGTSWLSSDKPWEILLLSLTSFTHWSENRFQNKHKDATNLSSGKIMVRFWKGVSSWELFSSSYIYLNLAFNWLEPVWLHF